jgi:dTMP kinase
VTEDSYRPPKKHKLICLEGIDSSGKSTQSKLLHKALVGSILFDFPNYNSVTGKFVKSMLEGKISYHSHTWACVLAANRYEDREAIIGALRHSTVVCNRYWPSNLVYSSASGLDPEWLVSLDREMPKPDLVIVIDVPPEVSMERKTNRDVIERDLLYLRKVRNLYRVVGETLGWCLVDGVQKVENVHHDVVEVVNKKFHTLGGNIQTPPSQPV